MSAPEKCPKCGVREVYTSHDLKSYACGTLVSASGRFFHTGTCQAFVELRKPLDAERDQLAERVKRLEEAGRALAKRHLLVVVTYPQAQADVAEYEKAIQ